MSMGAVGGGEGVGIGVGGLIILGAYPRMSSRREGDSSRKTIIACIHV